MRRTRAPGERMRPHRSGHGFVKEEKAGDYIRMTFLTGSLMGFSRWFMLYGDHAKIVEPAELNDKVVEIAENILKKLEISQMLLT